MTSTRLLSGTTALLLFTLAGVAPSCKSADDTMSPNPGAAECSNPGGPVEDGAKDLHCTDGDGQPIVQVVGKCQGGSVGAAGSGGDGAGGAADVAPNDEEYTVLTSHQGADDDCKYDVSFSQTCVEVNRPVTFTLTLTERASGGPATGARPDSPEIFLADNPSHISPSIGIKAPESPDGTYAIGPILFDRSGRWVVRFHFYEACSDIPADSPHGHAAFYIDVP